MVMCWLFAGQRDGKECVLNELEAFMRLRPEVNLWATIAKPVGPGPKGLRTGSPWLLASGDGSK